MKAVVTQYVSRYMCVGVDRGDVANEDLRDVILVGHGYAGMVITGAAGPPISSASLVPVMTPRMLMSICRSDTASDSWAPFVVEDVEVAEPADGQHGRVNLVGQRLELVLLRRPVGSLRRQATLGPDRAGAHWIAGSSAVAPGASVRARL